MYRMKLDLSIWDILGAVDDTKKKEKNTHNITNTILLNTQYKYKVSMLKKDPTKNENGKKTKIHKKET